MTLLQSPYLKDQRNFPNEHVKSLGNEVDRAYIDIAQKVNIRTIGVFALNNTIVTGEQWYLQGSSQKLQSQRKLFTFTTTAPINHGINLSTISQFTRMYGQFTDGNLWYGLFASSNISIAGQRTFCITPTQIVILDGGGTPALTYGNIVLEWLA